MFPSNEKFIIFLESFFQIQIQSSKINLLKNKISDFVYKDIELKKEKLSFSEFTKYIKENFEITQNSNLFNIRISFIREMFYENNKDSFYNLLSVFEGNSFFIEKKENLLDIVYFIHQYTKFYPLCNTDYVLDRFKISEGQFNKYKFIQDSINKEEIINRILKNNDILSFLEDELKSVNLSKEDYKKAFILLRKQNNYYILFSYGIKQLEGPYDDLFFQYLNNPKLRQLTKQPLIKHRELADKLNVYKEVQTIDLEKNNLELLNTILKL